jgi:hypothetical protein
MTDTNKNTKTPEITLNSPLFIDSVKGSVLYADYKEIGFLPKIDVLLDWRNRLNERKEDDVLNPPDWYDREIRAVDYLLSLHYP